MIICYLLYNSQGFFIIPNLRNVDAVKNLIAFVGAERNDIKILIVAVAKLLVNIGSQVFDEGEAKEVEGVDACKCVVGYKQIKRHGIGVEETHDVAHIVECFGNKFNVADAGDILLRLLGVVAIGRENGL